MRAAGFIDRLRTAGVTVEDRGDALREVFIADEMASRARNLATVVRGARTVVNAGPGALADGALPVVMGGDCTISLGVVAGAQRPDPATRLLYLDGDADLATPATTSSGVLDAMGIAHLLGLADTELARLGVDVPMLTDGRLALIGHDDTDPETFAAEVLRDRPESAQAVGASGLSGTVRTCGLCAGSDAAGRAGRAGVVGPDLCQLRYFVAIAETGGFTAAAG